MALFTMIIRKMVKNKWLVASLLIGMLMTSALVSTMPIYAESILSRMLVKDLEQTQIDRNTYPTTHFSKVNFSDGNTTARLAIIADVNRYMNEEAAPGFGIPVLQKVFEQQTKLMTLKIEGHAVDKRRTMPTTILKAVHNFKEHIRLIDGRLPGNTVGADGIYEVMVNEGTLMDYNFVLGDIIQLDDTKSDTRLRIKPVGVFRNKADEDLYFRNITLSDFNRSFVMDEGLFEQEFVKRQKAVIAAASWYFVLDYTKMELRRVDNFLQTDKDIKRTILSKVAAYQTEFTTPSTSMIEKYFERAERLDRLMWALNVPVLIMLAFYMFMVANLIVDRQKNEIAVLRSRGASRLQIVLSFAVEGLILSAVAFAAGPVLGMLLTQLLGASNGFLEFVNRAKLPVYLNAEAYRYSAIAAGASFLTMLIPVTRATRTTIVGHKQQLARMQRTPFWHKAFLDLLLLGVSIYGLYAFRKQLANLQTLGLAEDDLGIEPLQFIVPALFIVGAGLLLLRLYPLLLRLVYRIGRKWWPPSWYATLIQVGRSSSQYQFLMIFLIITIATGVFSAGAARTLNNNMEERLRYGSGADYTITSTWPNDAPPPATGGPGGMGGMGGGDGSGGAMSGTTSKTIHYSEPPFDPYTKLPGVESSAKVFIKKDALFSAEDENGNATLIGIDTDDFGRTAWFSDHLLDYPLNDYLNLLAADSRGVLISETLARQKNLKPGDSIWISWGQITQQPFIVYGVIKYFPTFNPNPLTRSVANPGDADQGNAPMLIVGHLSRIQLQLALEPYQVWLKVAPDISTAQFYKGIEEAHLNATRIVNTRELLVKEKNDPFLMALNGILTLGFILSIAVTFVGFLLYWMLSLKGRTLQNGIMRALGLTLRQLIGMLGVEQLLTSGMAIMIGIIVGNVTSRLFVPNFQMAFNPGSLVPPFRVVLAAGDYARLYGVVGFILLIGLGILGFMLSRVRIHQALKLGED